jgi:hypothetical protein
MTEPISDATLRAKHGNAYPDDDPYCRVCGTSWPCVVIRTLNVSATRIDELTDAVKAASTAMHSITERHPDSPRGEHPAVDICADALPAVDKVLRP